jgi:hypothetical protein
MSRSKELSSIQLKTRHSFLRSGIFKVFSASIFSSRTNSFSSSAILPSPVFLVVAPARLA